MNVEGAGHHCPTAAVQIRKEDGLGAWGVGRSACAGVTATDAASQAKSACVPVELTELGL